MTKEKANQFSLPAAIYNNDILEMKLNTQWKCKQCLLSYLQFKQKKNIQVFFWDEDYFEIKF